MRLLKGVYMHAHLGSLGKIALFTCTTIERPCFTFVPSFHWLRDHHPDMTMAWKTFSFTSSRCQEIQRAGGQERRLSVSKGDCAPNWLTTGIAVGAVALLSVAALYIIFRRGLFAGQFHCVYGKHRSKGSTFTPFGIATIGLGARQGLCGDHIDAWQKENKKYAIEHEPA